MAETIEELRAEIERLERENRDLKSRSEPPSAVLTSIEGLETFAMRIAEDERILHVNTAFARHLGIANKDELIGQKASVLRRFLNQEMLMAIARPAEGESLMRMAHDEHGKVFKVKTTLHSGMLDVVMQDVTNEQQFRSLVQRYVLKDFENLSEEDLRTFRFPERRFMTISFTDLRGFTALTERLNPEEVRGMVNAYYEQTIRTVEDNDGSVIQLIGDAVMAFYGAPRSFKDHALRAVKTACEQIERVNDLCTSYAEAGKEMSKCGVGINSGDVVLGNMGGAGKQSYTALGMAVNLASRLCSAARGGQVLLTEVVLNAVLEVLPPGWEMIESRSVLGDEDEDLASIRGKIEGVERLPDKLKGKVVSIGPGIKSQQNPPSFIFRYLYLLKPKGAKELPVITVESGRHGRKSRFLSDERASTQQAEIVIGKYHIVEAMGEGGMGKVWKARDQFGNIVAIKMLSAGQAASSTQLQRFKREADVMRKLSHHNICRIYEIGEAEGATFIAMECVDGVSLGDVIRHNTESASAGSRPRTRGTRSSELTDLVKSIKEEKKAGSATKSGVASVTAHQRDGSSKSDSPSSVLLLPMQRVLAMMCDICEAVQFAHEHGVLHRDLKPENIMLRPDGEPVVMDFGLAKLEDQQQGVSISIEGQMVGTIEYMAPEQAQSSKHVTERADVYSLGAILYQLLTGRKHFESSGSLIQDAQTLQDYESPKLRQFNKEIDRDLETIVLKALRPAPLQRYTSVRHMLEDLKRYQEGDSITARAPTIADRVVKRIRKHRTVFAFSATLLLVALSFVGYRYLEWRKTYGDWTEEFGVDFSQDPPAGPEQVQWLKENFAFQNREATASVEPWPVRDGAIMMKQHEWCWLEHVQIRGDTKIFAQLRFKDKPEDFQICINARRKLRQWKNNPPGYSCRVGIWAGSMDLVTRNDVDRPSNFSNFVVSSVDSKTRDVSLAFQRQGEKVTLEVNGKKVHEETYLLPLVIERDAQGGGTAQYENIGLRTGGQDVEMRSIFAYRFKLPQTAKPTIAGDALADSGYLKEAIDKYRTIARDYKNVSPDISMLALNKAYLLATYLGDRHDGRHRNPFLADLRQMHSASGWRLFQGASRAILQKVEEVETLALWKDGKRREALANFPAIFKANPETRIVLECLRARAGTALEPEISSELLRWVPRTTRLAGLDITYLGLTDINVLAEVTSLRALQARINQLTSLEPLRKLNRLRSLSCSRNQLTSLEPIKDLGLFQLFCDDNKIESLAPIREMPLENLYVNQNLIKDLSPIKGKPIYDLDCSQNKIDSLEAVTELPELTELYCGQNEIQSLEPLRRTRKIAYLNCSQNKIVSLEPLAEINLSALNCSGNPIVSLEPFVSAKDPPASFIFDCDTLPDAEINRAIAAWSAKGSKFKFQVAYARLLLAQRTGRADEIKALGSEHAGHRYLFVEKPLTSLEANQFCEKAGGHLVTITDKGENEFLRQITPPGATCRIGLFIKEGNRKWVTGEPVTFVADLDLTDTSDARAWERATTWKEGSWAPTPLRWEKPMSFIIEWD